jgi:hypothetical protein
MGLSKPRYASNLAFVVGDEDEPAPLGCATILQVIVADYCHSGAAAAADWRQSLAPRQLKTRI